MKLRNFIFLLLFAFSVLGQQDGIWLHPNRGQWDKEILYKVDLASGAMFLTNNGFTYVLSDFSQKHVHDQKHSITDTIGFQVIKSVFPYSKWQGDFKEDLKSTHYRNYFKGNDSAKWKSNINSYQHIELKDFFPNIDLLVDGKKENLEYSFVIEPKADVSQIQYKLEGADHYYIDENGNLRIKNRFGEIIEKKPAAWYLNNETQKSIPVKFKLENGLISFAFPEGYDTSQEIIIDPTLTFSTFTGATNDNWGMTATPDQNGNLYAGGIVFTGIGSYPTVTGSFNVNYNGGANYVYYTSNGFPIAMEGFDVAISKFSPDGKQLIFSTYLGGSGNEAPHSLVCDSNGDLYVFGVTSSSDFPVSSNAYDNSFNSGPLIAENELGYDGADMYITHFNASGSLLVGSTFIGGSGTDGINTGNLNYNYGDPFRGEIIVDNNGSVYVSSTTQSSDFPVKNAFQSNLNGAQDAVVLKLNSTLSIMDWSTYFGGSGEESGNSIQLSNNGLAYLTGGTTSTDLNFTVGESLNYNGGQADGYLVKLNANSGIKLAGTYMGMSEYDQSYFVQLDNNNDVYVYGQTESNWPITAGCYGNPNSGQFIRKYNSNLTTIFWTTMIGAGTGNVEISPTAFLVSNCKEIYITGWGGDVNTDNSQYALNSTTFGFPTTPDAFQKTTNGSNFYIAVLSKDANTLKYGTYMGGISTSYNHVDGGTSRFDKNGKIYHAVCAGCGRQVNGFTTTPGVYAPNNGSQNCNLAAFKFELNSIESVLSSSSASACANKPIQFTSSSTNGGDTFLWYFGDGTKSNLQNPIHSYSVGGTYTVSLVVSSASGCLFPDSTSFQVQIKKFQGGVVQPNQFICAKTAYQLEALGGTNYKWSPSSVLDDPTLPKPTAIIDTTTTFQVIVSDSCGSDTLFAKLEVFSTIPKISPDTSICLGASVQLQITNSITQSWTPIATLTNPTSKNPIAQPLTNTLYYCDSKTLDNCSFHDSVLVEVFYSPPVPQLIDSIKSCRGGELVVVAKGASEYFWTGVGINLIVGDTLKVIPNQDQYYYCEFKNSCGVSEDSVFVSTIFPNVIAGNDTTICFNSFANVWASGADTYHWYPVNSIDNATNSQTVVRPDSTTIYYVIGKDIIGCLDTAFVKIIVSPTPIFNVQPFVYAVVGDIVPISATSKLTGTYQWFPNEFVSCTNCQNTFVYPDKNFTYTVQFTDSIGCKVEKEVQLFYDGNIYVPNSFMPNSTSLNKEFKAITSNLLTFKMNIFDRWGEIVFTSTSPENAWDGTYKDSPCQIGTYVWKIQYTDLNYQKGEMIGHVNLIR